jgi:hypothetical protein
VLLVRWLLDVLDFVVIPCVVKKSQESGKDGANRVVFTKCTTESSSQDLSAFVRVLGRV